MIMMIMMMVTRDVLRFFFPKRIGEKTEFVRFSFYFVKMFISCALKLFNASFCRFILVKFVDACI